MSCAKYKVSKTTYQRKLPSKSAQEKFIFITKDALKLFPPTGKPFNLQLGEKEFKANIQGKSCQCMGPDKPHAHYYLEGRGLKKSLPWGKFSEITIRKISEGKYSLSYR